ncbi:hypothetical protein [Streptomyces sp. NPDC046909]|uniref:hypothetical protein n=1 Tax=Streptomyces sp. NPDC046909 TaxID=3155617 RepID=UPI0033ECC7AB
MTWPAALPGAALRSLRTAAGRRALHLVLLVGGLVVLGFLCGGQASAAEDVPTAGTSLTSTVAPDVLPLDALGETVDASISTVSTVSAVVPTSADDKVLRPVGDLVETVTEQLGEVQAQLPALPLPSLPEEPSLPELPGLPEVPTVPALPGVPSAPAQTLPAAATPQSEAPVADSSEGDDSGTRSGEGAVAEFYGPPSVGGSSTAGTATRAGGPFAAQGAHAPVPQVPGGDPGGAPVNRPSADSGSSRHGDAQAVSLNQRAPLRLVAGAAARDDAFGTRDRHRDIPVSPA